MLLSVSTLIPIIATVIYGVIFAMAGVSKPRNRLKQVFSIYLFTMMIWSISGFLVLSGLVEAFPWFKVMSAATLAMLPAFFFFVQTLFGYRRKWAFLILLYALLAIIITLFSKWVFISAFLDQTGAIHYEQGSLFIWVAAPGYSLSIVCVRDLVQGYKKTRDARQQNLIRYLIIAFLISILGTLSNLTALGHYPVDIASNCVSAMLIAYAILRHKLLDIQVIIRVGLVYSFITAVFGALYYLSISLLLNIFQIFTGKAVFYISILAGAATAILLNPLRTLAQAWIDRIFYRDKYNAELMLQRLSQTITSVLDIEKITHLILSEIRDTLHIDNGAILLKYSESSNFQVIEEDQGEKHFPSGFRIDHPIVTWMIQRGDPLIYHDLSLLPLFKSMWKEEKEELEKFNPEIFLPLNSKGELIGILALSKKKSDQPFTQDEQLIFSTLANQTAVAMENARLYDELRASFVQSVTALANAIDIRDTYTNTHSQEIANWAAKTARELRCTTDEIREVYLAGLLHDIGKIGIPDSILQKPAKLTEEEWKIVHSHPQLGADLIAPIKRLAGVSPMIENSHERFDGLGYPYGKKGEEIPLGARIISVVDSYSAMHDKRPYKEPYSRDKIIRELTENSGKMYDPKVVEAFLKIIPEEDDF
jgi:HD-GYP domain-containing protein (c-di-GMP phosphodiesterase class II)